MKDPAAFAAIFPPSAKVRVVNVWATWCVPCVEEMPVLHSIDQTFGAEVAMLGITLDDMIPGDRAETKKKVVRFLDSKQVAFPNAYYTGSSDALADHLRIDGSIPITIIYDGKGKELWRFEGALERDQIIRKIRESLRRK